MSEIEVKALEWEYREQQMMTYVIRDYRGIVYHINQTFGADSYYFTTVRYDGEILYDGDDLPSAKAAAQSDFEARTRSALVSIPPAAPTITQEMVDAFRMDQAQGRSLQSSLAAALSASPSPAGERLLTCQCAGSKTDPCIICGKGKTLVTAEWVQKMAAREGDLDATTGPASPSPVDSRELIERLVKALEEIAASRRMNCHEMSDEERAEYWSALALRYRSIASKALAAKEQQP